MGIVEDCPVHGHGPWPPRCEECGRFLPWTPWPMDDDSVYADGVPCNHPGCLSHVSHPCEGCGRVSGINAVLQPNMAVSRR